MIDNKLVGAMRDNLSGRNNNNGGRKSVAEQYTESYIGPAMALCTAVGLVPIIVKTIRSFKSPNNYYSNNK